MKAFEKWWGDVRGSDFSDEAYAAASEAWQAALRRAAELASKESEPEEGCMPSEIIEAVMSGDTYYVERAIIAAVRATKKNIVNALTREAGGE